MQLLSQSPVQLAGLGAQEVVTCLYGNDLDEHTTPVEIGLTWVIGMYWVALIASVLIASDIGKDRRETGNLLA